VSPRAGGLRGRVLRASGFHAPRRGAVEALAGALIAIDAEGDIEAVLRPGEPDHAALAARAAAEGRLVDAPPGTALLPGFVDLHVHAPQIAQRGLGLDVPLEVWLHRYTFPLEARYADPAFARAAYAGLVDDLLARGTTTAVYFATVHREATRLLVDLCLERGQRALVGKVAMDEPASCPAYYRDANAAAGIAGTRDLVDYVRAHPANGAGLVLPAVTPRFIPACTDALLEGLGRLARECGCHVQTHVAESDWEEGAVRARTGRSDAASLDAFGLVGARTVLAHGVFLSRDDMALLARRGAGVAHCPLSNAYFAGAVFPLRRALDRGVKVGLGTDVSGGPALSMLESCRAAVLASRLLESGVDPDLPPDARSAHRGARIDILDAFHLATAGGADVLGLPVGRLARGCHFDAILVEAGAAALDDDPRAALQRLLHTAGERDIAEVYVAGERVR
jgi:guanine deaminase